MSESLSIEDKITEVFRDFAWGTINLDEAVAQVLALFVKAVEGMPPPKMPKHIDIHDPYAWDAGFGKGVEAEYTNIVALLKEGRDG